MQLAVAAGQTAIVRHMDGVEHLLAVWLGHAADDDELEFPRQFQQIIDDPGGTQGQFVQVLVGKTTRPHLRQHSQIGSAGGYASERLAGIGPVGVHITLIDGKLDGSGLYGHGVTSSAAS